MENITIHTHITKADLLRFNIRYIATASFTYKYMVAVVLAVIAYICFSRGMPSTAITWLILIAGALLAGLLATLVYSAWCIGCVLIMSKESNGVLGTHEYTLKEEGLFEKTIANETLHKWGALGKVSVAGPDLLLQVTGYLYHVFPRKSFATAEQRSEFERLLRYHIDKEKAQ